MRQLAASTCLAFILLLTGVLPALAQGPVYTVRPGESLNAVAAANGVSVDALARANGLTPNSWIRAGQTLAIPQTAPANPAFQQPLAYPQTAPYFSAPVQPANFFPAPAQLPTTQPGYPVNGWTKINPYRPAGPAAYPQPASPGFTAPAPTPRQWPPQNPAPATANGQKWIDVNLSTQSVTAYEGQTPVFHAIVSTGTWQHPTVVGTYRIYVKYERTRMRGGFGADAYDLPNVPYVMYFYKGYGLHGTYWHNNFGTPMSHGCVNLPTRDAQWLYNWAPIGTTVVTHY